MVLQNSIVFGNKTIQRVSYDQNALFKHFQIFAASRNWNWEKIRFILKQNSLTQTNVISLLWLNHLRHRLQEILENWDIESFLDTLIQWSIQWPSESDTLAMYSQILEKTKDQSLVLEDLEVLDENQNTIYFHQMVSRHLGNLSDKMINLNFPRNWN